MYIYAKIGTHPQGRYKVMRKRNAPKERERLTLRAWDEWQDFHVIVDKIVDMGNYKLHFCDRL